MLRFIICSLLLAAGPLHAQSDPLVVPPDGATALHLEGFFGSVELAEGSGRDIIVRHLITVNDTPRPDLGKLEVSRDGSTITVTEAAPREENLRGEWNKISTVIDGRVVRGHDGHNVDIRITVEVPPGLDITVHTLYGGVTATDVAGVREVRSTYGDITVVYHATDRDTPLELYSNYGDVDLSLPAGARADVELETEFGELLTDFDIAIDTEASETRQFFERVVGRINGGGARVRCRSPYDHVYLRTTR